MEGSTLSYEQITTISQNLDAQAKKMQSILEELTALVGKIGNEDIWGGNAAMESKAKFDRLSGKFEEFYSAVTDESRHLASVVANYEAADTKISANV